MPGSVPSSAVEFAEAARLRFTYGVAAPKAFGAGGEGS